MVHEMNFGQMEKTTAAGKFQGNSTSGEWCDTWPEGNRMQHVACCRKSVASIGQHRAYGRQNMRRRILSRTVSRAKNLSCMSSPAISTSPASSSVRNVLGGCARARMPAVRCVRGMAGFKHGESRSLIPVGEGGEEIRDDTRLVDGFSKCDLHECLTSA